MSEPDSSPGGEELLSACGTHGHYLRAEGVSVLDYLQSWLLRKNVGQCFG